MKILHVIANLAPRYGGPSKVCKEMETWGTVIQFNFSFVSGGPVCRQCGGLARRLAWRVYPPLVWRAVLGFWGQILISALRRAVLDKSPIPYLPILVQIGEISGKKRPRMIANNN